MCLVIGACLWPMPPSYSMVSPVRKQEHTLTGLGAGGAALEQRAVMPSRSLALIFTSIQLLATAHHRLYLTSRVVIIMAVAAAHDVTVHALHHVRKTAEGVVGRHQGERGCRGGDCSRGCHAVACVEGGRRDTPLAR